MSTTQPDCSPGKFLVGRDGEALAIPSVEGKYKGSLIATDGAGATVVVKTWDFAVLPADVLVSEYGPKGKPCANGGEAIDDYKHDRKFTCDCDGSAPSTPPPQEAPMPKFLAQNPQTKNVFFVWGGAAGGGGIKIRGAF